MIKFNDISLKYDNKNLFRNLSFEIKSGEKVIILGKSGLGKSSLFKLLLGFEEIQIGEILFDRISINEKTVWDVRKKISYIDQDVSLCEGKVMNLINSIFEFQSNSSLVFSDQKINDLLEYFELNKYDLNKDIEDLSGGERQRLAIIISVLLERKVFLLDEVTSSLDKRLKEKVAAFFIGKKIWTVVVITHDLEWINSPLTKVFDLRQAKWILQQI